MKSLLEILSPPVSKIAIPVKQKLSLLEVYYGDYFPKAFDQFRKKYIKIAKEQPHEAGWLYVQFTSHQESILHKNPNPNPDHSDPVGIYAYPLEYVLKNPGDIWYGQRAKFIRVLRDKSKNCLRLQSMNRSNIDIILNKMFPHEDTDYLLKLATKVNRYRDWRNINKDEKNMMTVIQLDLSKPEKVKDSYSSKDIKYPTREGQEQTNLFIKAGYDAIEDSAKNEKNAIINDREPAQIVFLKRDAFEVVEIFQLRYEKTKDSDWVGTTADYKESSVKLAAMVAEAIGDKLINDKIETSDGGRFWTKQGRRIEIEIGWSSSRFKHMQNTMKMGQKKHKEGGLNSVKRPEITIYSEYGKIYGEYGEQDKFKFIADDMKRWFNSKKENPDTDVEWTPENKKEYERKKKEAKDTETKKYIEKQNKEHVEDFEDNYSNQIKEFASKEGLSWTPPETFEEKLEAMHDIDKIQNSVNRGDYPYSSDYVNLGAKEWVEKIKRIINELQHREYEEEDGSKKEYNLLEGKHSQQIIDIWTRAYEILSSVDRHDARRYPLFYALQYIKGERTE